VGGGVGEGEEGRVKSRGKGGGMPNVDRTGGRLRTGHRSVSLIIEREAFGVFS
jgi:hypothetical protein